MPPAWETLDADATLARLDAVAGGLSAEAAAARLARHGPNALPRARRAGPFSIFARQLAGPLALLLAAAAALSVYVGETTDASFIAIVLALNALVGGVQEWKAERGVEALQKLLRLSAIAVRDRSAAVVDAEALVPGDVVRIEAGQRVPADLRLLEARGLEIDESLLTGESAPVAKDARWRAAASTPVSDRRNLAFAGTGVARGRATGVVVATGGATEVGRIAREVGAASSPPPPLVRRLARFSAALAWATVVAAGLLGLVGVAQGTSPREMFLFAVALAVAVVPEGLPVAVTVALAVGTARMARRRVIVRRLAAVEGLGSCTLIATDKTGTLTENALVVREVRLADGAVLGVTGEGYVPDGAIQAPPSAASARTLARLLHAVALANEASLAPADGGWRSRGDPTDVALLALARKGGVDTEATSAGAASAGEIAFEPERRYAASFRREGGGVRVYAKGAPERIVAMCAGAEGVGRPVAAFLAEAEAMARSGYRVLAVADGVASAEAARDGVEPSGLTFLGLVGMIDPPRRGTREAVSTARGAGLRVVMITGDHPVTALAIARDLGLARDEADVATGVECDAVGEAGLAGLVATRCVFARVAPHHKLALVEAAQRAGHAVAVTGDGVNDAPALRAADLGVAMGKGGTDVARESADLVIADDDFASIVAGIEEGRIANDNIRKVVFLLVSTGAAEVALVALALLAGLPLALLPAQLLWLNLVTNGLQDKALAAEPGEGDVLARQAKKPPNPIFDRVMIERVLATGLAMGVVAFAVFAAALSRGFDEAGARNLTLLLMVIFENLQIGNARSETKSAFALSPFRNPFLLATAIGAQLLHLAAMQIPITQDVLEVAPVDAATWLALFVAGQSVVVVSEVQKVFLRRRVARAKQQGFSPEAPVAPP
ncbi:MAG TPA: HAD-IC family P-type ATPase [Candidatus Thermoplasmatota archaeon]|nr:HAD-IC family P-type ATPase [Candidatus Thermoplasmatota archaeon]